MDKRLDPRRMFGKFATGVCVILIEENEKYYRGLTVNSFTSVSLEPLLLSFSIKSKSGFFPFIDVLTSSQILTVNILSEVQKVCAGACSKFGGGLIPSKDIILVKGGFYIRDTLASIFCTVEKKVTAGDHVTFFCKVSDSLGVASEKKPLLFFDGQYAVL